MTETENAPEGSTWYRLLAVLVACAVVVTFAIFLWTRPHVEADEKRLQGVWGSDKLRLTFTGSVAVLEGLDSPRKFFFRLQPRAVPKRITVCDADGPTRPEWMILGMAFGPPVAANPQMEGHAIYELEGDRLRICWPVNPRGDFPKSFDPSIGMIQEYHRP